MDFHVVCLQFLKRRLGHRDHHRLYNHPAVTVQLSVASANYLLKSHLKEAFHSTFDGQQLGGKSGIAYTDRSVLFLIGIPVEKKVGLLRGCSSITNEL